MQIKKLLIENFRGIEKFERDFVDDFGNPAKVILLVGPNSSGKTSILDAIWFSLMSEMGYDLQRENFRPEKEFIVKTGENFTKVELIIAIGESELYNINLWKRQLNAKPEHDINANEVTVTWTYPAQANYRKVKRERYYGGYQYNIANGWVLLQGRYYHRKLSKLSAKTIRGRETVGGVYFFEQERRILSAPVKSYEISKEDDMTNESSELDIRSLLIGFGVRDSFGKFPKEQSWYWKIQQGFNEICAPHTMGNIYTQSSDSEFEIDFRDAKGNSYGFDGLSSGQRSILNFLVHYMYKQMFNSIVLIDELEMHLHPTWQRNILNYLRNRDDGNQFIIATHSPTLAMYVPNEHIINLGKLEEIPAWQYENVGENNDE